MSALDNAERRLAEAQAEVERLQSGDDGSGEFLAREVKKRFGIDMPARRPDESLTNWSARARREQEAR